MINTTQDIFEFIEETLAKSESVLIHSARGQSRASAVIAVYMMKRYKWTLLKTLEFLNSRRPDLEIRASFIQQLNMYENFLNQSGTGPKTQDWNEISEKTFYIENEELLLRNTFLNARMGPLVDYNNPQYQQHNQPRNHKRVVWADEERSYPQSNYQPPHRAKFVPVSNMKSNDLNSLTKQPQPNKQPKVPHGYNHESQRDAFRPININSNTTNNIRDHPERHGAMDNSGFQDFQRNSGYENQDYQRHINHNPQPQPQYQPESLNHKFYPSNYDREVINQIQDEGNQNDSNIQTAEEMNSRNEIFTNVGSDPLFHDRKPLSNIQAQVPKSSNHSTMSTKSKNMHMHTKINRGISPNQPPQKMKNYSENERKRTYEPSNIGKHSTKESSESARRSSSLKVKKENDKNLHHKPSTRSSNKGGGSFIVPSSGSKMKSSKNASGQNLRSSYNKNPTVGLSSHLNGSSSTNGQYKLGTSNYEMRNSSGNNFTANPRTRKPVSTSAHAHNTMASFRSGPVRVVNDTNNSRTAGGNTGHTSISNVKKDVSKRPSSAGKAVKKSSKITTKPSTRPGTASIRGNSNRPASPGSRSLKSDLLFNSYNKSK